MPHDSSTPKFSLADLCNAFTYGVQLGRSSVEHTSCSELATKTDVQEAKEEITMKVSEIKNDLVGMKAQLVKVIAEQDAARAARDAQIATQQAQFDALQKKFDELQSQIGTDGDVDPETVAALTDFKTALTAFDDTIPDAPETPPTV